jgi:UDPglucose 6-dehydrogenase
MKLTIVGTGYVGLVSGTCLADTGNLVTCLDIDPKKIDGLNAGKCPIYEPGLDQMIQRNIKSHRLVFTTDKIAAYQAGEAIFICVGTPPGQDGRADVSMVLQAARDIGDAIESRAVPLPGDFGRLGPVVVVKSTVPVGTNALVRKEILTRTKKPFRMASNPEFLKEGAAIVDFNKPDRVVIGVDDPSTGQHLTELYEPYVRQGNPIHVLDIPSAEMVKYASNAMLATKISFINEIAALCEAYGADVDEVRKGMCADKRIGNQFLYPGLGFGGSCFPKDVQACVSMGQQSGVHVALLEAVNEVNAVQRQRFIAKIDKHFAAKLTGRRFAVWGLAFKPGTDDMREAPSLTIIDHLLKHGATVRAYDPVAADATRRILGDKITFGSDELDTLQSADALVICTEWNEFRHPDFEAMKSRLAAPVIFDGRNLYKPHAMRQLGFSYYSVGRESVTR